MTKHVWSIEGAEFLQALSGSPWASDCGRVEVSRGRMGELDYGDWIEPAYGYWSVSYRADSGNGWSIVLRDDPSLSVRVVSDLINNQVNEYLALEGRDKR